MNSEKTYEKALELLKEAHEELSRVTNNQLGMPDHLMKVSRLFGEAKDCVEKLETQTKKESKKWYKRIHHMNSNSSNNNSKTKKRKRSNNNA